MVEILYQNCTLHYHGVEVLADYSFHLQRDKHAIIHGPTGSGKTMLLRSLAGYAQIKNGVASFSSNGQQISKADFHKITQLVEFAKPSKFFNPKNHFYQQRYHDHMEDDASSKSMTVEALLALKGYPIYDQKVQQFLKRAGLFKLSSAKLIQLSSGQRRKLQLIISFLHLPDVLLLDSPYIGLDEESRNDVNNWLQELTDEHNVQLIICADQRDTPTWISQHISLLARKTSLYNNHNSSVLQITKGNNNEFINDRLPVLELTNINVKYGNEKVLNNLSWKVNPGERVALLGKNGSGKSTLISLIYADNPKAYCNNIRVFGTQRGKGDNIWDIKKRTGFISSELHLYFTEKYSCLKVVATGFFDTKFIPRKLTDLEIERIMAYANYFEVSHLLEKEYFKISLGEQKLMLFIRALVKNPELLLLDEPYQGFDAEYILKANKLLNTLLKFSGTTLIFISHYKNEIPGCVDRVYQLTDGKIKEESIA